MAPPVPPPEHAADSAAPAPADAQPSLSTTPFLTKTYQLVDDPSIDDLISWNEDGSTFVVWRPAEFARDLLPKYFKHNNFSSFVRQLNTYGFRKIVPDRWEFANDCFRRGKKRLLCDIHRRKIQTPAAASAALAAVTVAVPVHGVASPTNSGDVEQAPSANSSPGAAPATSVRGSGGASSELGEDNHRLRKENERLKHELSQIKNLYNSVLLLMSKYASQQRQHPPSAGVGGCVRGTERPPLPSCPLELMPLTRCSGASERARPGGDNRVKPDDDEDDADADADADAEEQAEERSPSPRLFGVPIGIKRARGSEDESAADEQVRHRRVVEVKPEPLDPSPVEPPLEGARHRWRKWVCN